ELGGGYEYVKARSTDGMGVTHDDPLPRLTHNRWDAWVQGRPDPRFSGLVRIKYFGASIDQSQPVSGYATLEANVAAQVAKQYLLVLNVDDLSNVQPETRIGYHTAGRVISLILQGTWE